MRGKTKSDSSSSNRVFTILRSSITTVPHPRRRCTYQRLKPRRQMHLTSRITNIKRCSRPMRRSRSSRCFWKGKVNRENSSRMYLIKRPQSKHKLMILRSNHSKSSLRLRLDRPKVQRWCSCRKFKTDWCRLHRLVTTALNHRLRMWALNINLETAHRKNTVILRIYMVGSPSTKSSRTKRSPSTTPASN